LPPEVVGHVSGEAGHHPSRLGHVENKTRLNLRISEISTGKLDSVGPGAKPGKRTINLVILRGYDLETAIEISATGST